jgi:hypothetical protein
MTIAESLELAQAKREQGNWYPANQGTETIFRT